MPSTATALIHTGLQHGLDVYVIPALGGTAEKKVGDAAVPSLAWSADSRSLVIPDRPPPINHPAWLCSRSRRAK